MNDFNSFFIIKRDISTLYLHAYIVIKFLKKFKHSSKKSKYLEIFQKSALKMKYPNIFRGSFVLHVFIEINFIKN